MAVGLIASVANTHLTSLGDTYPYVKLHIGDPGAAGTSNPAGETDRVLVVWGTAASGTRSNTATVTWAGVSNAETYSHFSAWTASTSGSCGFTGTISANSVAVNDTFTIPIGDLDIGHTVAA